MKHAFPILCSLCLIIFFFRNPFRFKTGKCKLGESWKPSKTGILSDSIIEKRFETSLSAKKNRKFNSGFRGAQTCSSGSRSHWILKNQALSVQLNQFLIKLSQLGHSKHLVKLPLSFVWVISLVNLENLTGLTSLLKFCWANSPISPLFYTWKMYVHILQSKFSSKTQIFMKKLHIVTLSLISRKITHALCVVHCSYSTKFILINDF